MALVPDPLAIGVGVPDPILERTGRTGLSIEVMGIGVAQASEWKSFTYTEAIGQPDTMSVDVLGFTSDPGITAPVVSALEFLDNYFWTVVRLGDEVLFSGIIRPISLSKPARGALRYGLKADGWQFLMPRRLVGVPNGGTYVTTEDGDPNRIPTPVFTDPAAIGSPTAGAVADLFAHYWNSPWPIDVETFVEDILPIDAPVEQITWSGSDLEGAVSDLAAAGNSAALWWFANDSPSPGTAVAPHLALHFTVPVIPAEGDPPPANAAPMEISDTPEDGVSILAISLSFMADNNPRLDATYVRGATGFMVDAVDGVLTGVVKEGGTGWVGTPGGIWGEEYTDAPAAITSTQRDAFGNAVLASRDAPTWTGTIEVSGYDGWHKGQVVAVTDADYGFVRRWFLIRAVTMKQNDPQALANEYTLTVGDSLTPSLGYQLRQQRLKEARQEIAPATIFVPYPPGSLLIDPTTQTAGIVMQLAAADGSERHVAGVGGTWLMYINGVSTDPADSSQLFWLTDMTTTTDELGRIYATGHASADATAADAGQPDANVVL